MKKIFLSFILSIFFVYSINANAQNFIPRYIDIVDGASTPVFQAGAEFDFDVTVDKTVLPEGKTNVEYGVVRKIIQGSTISYEPVSVLKTEKSYTSPKSFKIKGKVPNVLNNSESLTYTVYAKITVVDDIDSENFIVSKQSFKIQGNKDNPFTKISYINFLHSNGKRYSLISGPTIYDLNKTSYKGVASTTSIEIVFDSNTDIVLNPNITFKKLRSDVVVPSLKSNPINVTKGTSTITLIPLPVFDYEPGVYQGTISFGNKDILDVDFQYIVSGDVVTFNQPVYSKTKEKTQVLDFKIYGTPVDFNIDPVLNKLSSTSTSSTSTVYATEFIVKDKNNKELYKVNKDIDFSTTTYRLEIPANIKNISKVSIKTTNSEGRVVYESTKDLNIPKDNTLKSVLIIILFVLVIVLFLIFKHKYVRAILFVIMLIVLGFWVNIAKADVWQLPFRTYLYYESGDRTYVANSSWVYMEGYVFKFNTNIVNERFYTNEDILVTYQAIHEFCYNWYENLFVSMSLNKNNADNHIGEKMVTYATHSGITIEDYRKYIQTHPQYSGYISKYGMSISNFKISDAVTIFNNEYATITGRHFWDDICIVDDEGGSICGKTDIQNFVDFYFGQYPNYINDYVQDVPSIVSTNTNLSILFNATRNSYLYSNGFIKTCVDTLNCGYQDASDYNISSNRHVLITRWITENLGKPQPVSTSTTLYISRRVTGQHYSDIRYGIPLQNIVDPNASTSLSVNVDNVTQTSARVNWVYENPKLQTNYQVELSTNEAFSNIVQTKTFSPVVLKTMDKYVSVFNNLLGIKKVDAATLVQDVRNVTVDNLQPNIKYYVRMRAQNSDGWTGYVSTSFTTLADVNNTCACNKRDLVCVQNGVTSTTTAAAVCKLSVGCSVFNGPAVTTFNALTTNLLGTVSYSYTSSDPVTVSGSSFIMSKKNSVQSVNIIATDSYDSQTASTACTIDNTIITPPVVPSDPKITIEKDPIISLNSGGNCKITWELIDIPPTVSCSLTGTNIPSETLTSSGFRVFESLTSNQKYTVTCSGVPLLKPLTVSTICRVNSEVKEK